MIMRTQKHQGIRVCHSLHKYNLPFFNLHSSCYYYLKISYLTFVFLCVRYDCTSLNNRSNPESILYILQIPNKQIHRMTMNQGKEHNNPEVIWRSRRSLANNLAYNKAFFQTMDNRGDRLSRLISDRSGAPTFWYFEC